MCRVLCSFLKSQQILQCTSPEMFVIAITRVQVIQKKRGYLLSMKAKEWIYLFTYTVQSLERWLKKKQLLFSFYFNSPANLDR